MSNNYKGMMFQPHTNLFPKLTKNFRYHNIKIQTQTKKAKIKNSKEVRKKEDH